MGACSPWFKHVGAYYTLKLKSDIQYSNQSQAKTDIKYINQSRVNSYIHYSNQSRVNSYIQYNNQSHVTTHMQKSITREDNSVTLSKENTAAVQIVSLVTDLNKSNCNSACAVVLSF